MKLPKHPNDVPKAGIDVEFCIENNRKHKGRIVIAKTANVLFPRNTKFLYLLSNILEGNRTEFKSEYNYSYAITKITNAGNFRSVQDIRNIFYKLKITEEDPFINKLRKLSKLKKK